MDKLDYQHLFLIRHGEYYDERLKPEGREQLEGVAKIINPKVVPYVIFMSSIERRGIDSALVFMDNLKEDKGYDKGNWLITINGMEDSGEKSFTQFIQEANKNRLGRPTLIAIGHRDFCASFPSAYLSKFFGKTDIPRDFGAEYGTGVYINLETGEWERIC